MLKSFFLSQKKLLNAILRAKLNYKKKIILMNEMFLQCRRQHFMSLSFFAEKVILELKCTKSLLELLRTPETDFHEFELFCRKSHFRA